MSIKATTHLSRPDGMSNPKTHPTQTSDTNMDKVDARWKHISEHIIQSSPYILTIPTDRPHRVPAFQADNWRRGMSNWWEPHEEQLQYMSFLPREWDDPVLKAIGGWDNEKGELVPEQATGNTYGGRSGTTTPAHGQGPKKKISLADYKLKKNGLSPATNAAQTATSSQPVVAPVQNPVTKAEVPKPVAESQPTLSQKRSHEEMLDNKQSLPDSNMDQTANASAKKPKVASMENPTKEIKPSTKAPEKLTIPSLLSPTLPASIEEELKKILSTSEVVKETSQHKKNVSTAPASSMKQSSSSQLSSPSISQDPKLAKEKPKVNGKTSVGSSLASSQTIKALPNYSSSSLTKLDPSTKQQQKNNLVRNVEGVAPARSETTPKKAVNGSSQKDAIHSGTGPKVNTQTRIIKNGITQVARKEPANSIKGSKTPEPSLIVKLKYKKQQATRINLLLRLTPQPKKETASVKPSHGEGKDSTATATKKDKNFALSSQHDRVHSTQNSQRERVHPTLKSNSNSVQGINNTNAALNDSTPKSVDSAKKRRVEQSVDNTLSNNKRQKLSNPELPQKSSTQNHGTKMSQLTPKATEIKTPQGLAQNMTPIPSSVEKTNRKGNPSAGSGSTHSEEASSWKKEFNTLSTLARSLKHTVDDLAKITDDADKDHAEKVIVATAIECIITYIFAFASMDEATKLQKTLPDPKAWNTLIAYIQRTNSMTLKFPLMHGLCKQMEAVVRSTILSYDFEQKKSQANGCSSPTASRDSELLKVHAMMNHNVRAEQKAWQLGATELSVDDLMQYFPKTWSRKAKAPNTSGTFVIGALGGDFYLPLGNFSTVVEAGRAGWSILEEWCEQEHLGWKAQLKL